MQQPPVTMTLAMLAAAAAALLAMPDLALAQEVCYPPLGCFSTAEPWSSPPRPLPPPDSPQTIQTTFYLYTRDRPALFELTTVPEASLNGTDFNPKRPTVFIVHGFLEHVGVPWMEKMKDALLKRANVNVFLTDWAKGSFELLNYLQAAANTRIVGAQIARLIHQLEANWGARPQDVHVIGFSLGGQVAAYAGKAVKGLGKITALDPAQPAFEGYPAAVRLTRDDALFVEVLHTSGRPFVPLGGYGLIAPHGHVDYYINNGAYQPGCTMPLVLPKLPQTLEDLINIPVDVIQTVVACDHDRAHQVYTQMLLSSACTFWGHPAEADAREVGKPCTAATCVTLSYESTRALRAGSYIVPTSASPPYCIADPTLEAAAARAGREKLLDVKMQMAFSLLGPLLQVVGGVAGGLAGGLLNG